MAFPSEEINTENHPFVGVVWPVIGSKGDEYSVDYKGYWVEAERLNGRLAMIGFFAAIHNYILFGAVMPGIF